MLDVDDLKRLNDSRGHAAGDAVLRALGDLLLGNVRGEDIPCRYGGDEFIVVMPDATRQLTRERAKRICRYARGFRLCFEGQTLEALTLSLGIATFPENGSTSAAILRAADAALYRAKRAGRGRVIAAV
jgi:diguanylate cyclase (GGDEF)-like protein